MNNTENQPQRNDQSERESSSANVDDAYAGWIRRIRIPKITKNWSHRRSMSFAHWASAIASILLFLVVVIQTYYTREAINESTSQFSATIAEIKNQSKTLSRILIEQQRARLSFKILIEEFKHQGKPGFRIVAPLEIGGTTEARSVKFKNHFSYSKPRQRQYILSVNLNWEARAAHNLSDVSPTESGRRFVAEPLTPQQISMIISTQKSLYFIARLEYCDIFGECRYFMRCAELGNNTSVVSVVTYCGTQIGRMKLNKKSKLP